MFSILIIKLSALGDIVQAFQAVHCLKINFPDCVIDWVVERSAVDLVDCLPFIRRTIAVNTRSWRKEWWKEKTRREILKSIQSIREEQYQLAIDLQGNGKSALVSACVRCKMRLGFAWKEVAEKWNFFLPMKRYAIEKEQNRRLDYLSLIQAHFHWHASPPAFPALIVKEEEKKAVDQLFNGSEMEGKTSIAIALGSRWKNKQLLFCQWHGLLNGIQEKEKSAYFFFLWGNEKEKQQADQLHDQFKKSSTLLPRFSFPALWQFFQSVDRVLAVDSFLLHLAGLTSTPTMSLFGPSSSSVYAPFGTQHFSLQGSCPFREKFHYRCSFLRSCITGDCLHQISPEQMVRAYFQWVKSTR